MIISDLQFYDILWKYKFESLSLRKNRMQIKENPCKLIIYGDFLFLLHSKNKHIKAFFRCTIRCTLLPLMSGTPIWWIIHCLSVFCILTCCSWKFSFVIKKTSKMERTTFCLLFYIRRTKLNRNGEAPIMMRIAVNGV